MLGFAAFLTIAVVVITATLSLIIAHELLHPPRRTTAYALARRLPVDPGELGLRFSSWTLERADGAALPVWEIESQETDDRDVALLLVHDHGSSRIDLLQDSAALCGGFARVVLYDRRGHGEATGSAATLGRNEDYDLAALAERCHGSRIALIGYGTGAMVALSAAARIAEQAPARIASIVAHNPTFSIRESAIARLRRDGRPTRPFVDLALWWLGLLGGRPIGAPDSAAPGAPPLLVLLTSCEDGNRANQAHALARSVSDGRFVNTARRPATDDNNDKAPDDRLSIIRSFLSESID